MNKQLLTIGETARRLGVSVEHLRRSADKGEIKATRTRGGHRRFSEESIAEYEKKQNLPTIARQRPQIANKKATPMPRKTRRAPTPSALERFEAELPNFIGDEEYLFEPVREQPQEVMNREAEEEARRVRKLKEYGMACIPYRLPAEWKVKVIAALEEQVTAARVPSWLSLFDQHIAVQGIVSEVRRSYEETVERQKEAMRKEEEAKRKEEEAKRKEAEAQQQADLEELKRERRVDELIRYAISYTKDETEDWDFASKCPARREIEKVLKSEVKADWTEEDVEDWVDEILEQWEEDKDDE